MQFRLQMINHKFICKINLKCNAKQILDEFMYLTIIQLNDLSLRVILVIHNLVSWDSRNVFLERIWQWYEVQRGALPETKFSDYFPKTT